MPDGEGRRETFIPLECVFSVVACNAAHPQEKTLIILKKLSVGARRVERRAEL